MVIIPNQDDMVTVSVIVEEILRSSTQRPKVRGEVGRGRVAAKLIRLDNRNNKNIKFMTLISKCKGIKKFIQHLQNVSIKRLLRSQNGD